MKIEKFVNHVTMHFYCTDNGKPPQWCNGYRGGFKGGGGGAPPKIGKNMIFFIKIMIFHTKYQKKNLSAPPLTWYPGSAPGLAC